MVRILLSALLTLSSMSTIFSQKVAIGHVLEDLSKRAIPYANIGIPYTTKGTISNEDGSFTLEIGALQEKDTIYFSALGFTTQKIPVSQISTSGALRILLKEKVTQLDPVTVSAKKQKRKTFWLGNKFSKGGNIYADSLSAGSAMALLIENKYPAFHKDLTYPIFLEQALLKIAANAFDEFKVRIRILAFDTVTQLPGKDLLNENLVVASGIKSGWVEFDLSPYDVEIDQPSFFLVFEWILADNDRMKLMDQYKQYKKLNPEKVTIDTMMVRNEKIPYYNWNNFFAGTSFGVSPIQFSLNNYKCYYRNNSFGEWKRASTILTARLLVSDQPR